MAYIEQPINSQIFLTPHSQRLLQYSTTDSRVYLSRATNTLLHPYTFGYYDFRLPDKNEYPAVKLLYTDRTCAIVDGMINEYDYDTINNIFKVKISPGSVISDSTLLVFPNECELDVDLTTMAGYGFTDLDKVKIILSVNYQWIETVYQNVPTLKLTMLDVNNSFISRPDTWQTKCDRLVINVFEIDITTGEVNSLNPIPAENYEKRWINIGNMPYEIGPQIAFLENFNNYLEKHYAKKQIVWTQPVLNPETLKENMVSFPIQYFKDEKPGAKPIIGIRFDINYDPKFLHYPRFVWNADITTKYPNKLKTIFVDHLPSGEETGVLQLQIGDSTASSTTGGTLDLTELESIELGELTFSFNKDSPEGTICNISFPPTDIFFTHNDASTTTPTPGKSLFVQRIDPIRNETVISSPAKSETYQPASINFGKCSLSDKLFLAFNLNGVRQKIYFDSTMITNLRGGLELDYNSDIKLLLNANKELVVEGKKKNLVLDDGYLTNNANDHKRIPFKLSSFGGQPCWMFDASNFYWLPRGDNDRIIFTLSSKPGNPQTYTLSMADLTSLMTTPMTWITFPTAGLDFSAIELFYIPITSDPAHANTAEIYVRLPSTISAANPLSSVVLYAENGSQFCDHIARPSIYKASTNDFELIKIDLTPEDYIEYEEVGGSGKQKLIITQDIFDLITSDPYGYIEGNLRITIDSTTTYLHCEPVSYNTTYNYFAFINVSYDENRPDPTQYPCIWSKDTFISTRIVGNPTFVKDKDKEYSTPWELYSISTPGSVGSGTSYTPVNLDGTGGERDFYTVVDLTQLSNLRNYEDVIVQCYCNNQQIQPELVEILDDNTLKIWMPETFVFKTPMDQIKIIIVG